VHGEFELTSVALISIIRPEKLVPPRPAKTQIARGLIVYEGLR